MRKEKSKKALKAIVGQLLRPDGKQEATWKKSTEFGTILKQCETPGYFQSEQVC
jgi:hypothetical protein